MTTAKKRKLPSDFHDVEVGIERPRILDQHIPRKTFLTSLDFERWKWLFCCPKLGTTK